MAKINGVSAKPSAFNDAVELLEAVTGRAVDASSIDQENLSKKTVLALLDKAGNKNGRFETSDLLASDASIDSFVLHDFCHFLEKYKFVSSQTIENLWKLEDALNNKVKIQRFAKIVSVNFKKMKDVPADFQQQVWDKVLQDLKIFYPRLADNPQIKTYDQFIRYIKNNGIQFISRISSVRTALELIYNRQHLDDKTDTRPIAFLAYNTFDPNHSFDKVEFTDPLVHDGQFRVVYFELETKQKLLEAATSIVKQSGRKIDVLVLAGHGSPDSLTLGKDPEEGEIDVYDAAFFRALEPLIDPNGQVVLEACLNGEGADQQLNFTNFVAAHLPRREIISSQISVNRAVVSLNGLKLVVTHPTKNERPYNQNLSEEEAKKWLPTVFSDLQIGASIALASPEIGLNKFSAEDTSGLGIGFFLGYFARKKTSVDLAFTYKRTFEGPDLFESSVRIAHSFWSNRSVDLLGQIGLGVQYPLGADQIKTSVPVGLVLGCVLTKRARLEVGTEAYFASDLNFKTVTFQYTPIRIGFAWRGY